MNKYIFLDVDGVLNIQDPDRPGQFIFNDRTIHRMGNLFTLAERRFASIVLSSNWRHHFTTEPLNSAAHFLLGLFKGWNLQIAALTGTSPLGRGQEIKDFLKDDPTAKFVILDDIDQFDDDLKPFLVKTDPEVGFCERSLNKALEILKWP